MREMGIQKIDLKRIVLIRNEENLQNPKNILFEDKLENLNNDFRTYSVS